MVEIEIVDEDTAVFSWDGRTYGFRARFEQALIPRIGQNLRVLPEDMPLDGELFAGRGKFDVASSIVRTTGTANEARWKELVFSVFDAPGEASKDGDPGFEKRLAALERRPVPATDPPAVGPPAVARPAAPVARNMADLKFRNFTLPPISTTHAQIRG